MVNVEKFIKRLEQILEYYSLTASSFADKINVQRSSLSHLLSGRNKPSLEFIMKIMEEFPDVSLEWIIYGKGEFPKEEKKKLVNPKIESVKLENLKIENKIDLFSDSDSDSNKTFNIEEGILKSATSTPLKNMEIERIVIFYNNGTFKNYNS